MDVTEHLPAHLEAAKVREPRAGPLDFPSTWLVAHEPKERLLSTTTNVTSNAAGPDCLSNGLGVVALVEEQVFGAARTTFGVAHDDLVEELLEGTQVRLVGAAEEKRERDTVAIDQDVLLRAAASPVDGRRADKIPPFGAFVMKPSAHVHCQSSPSSSS